ncbi:chemotaxis protein CheB [Calycomorphotria hydatis]|uniref:Aerobic respiration control sensor protein ArcB n=1 Tax=Calycomorphotria hydatis TaxID=2528027 RepID=A0A517T638_9PLAN|nr:chemotaxis protein CheB [Calycomorphotria hydatis]QDT63846.1 Aerobic respiration control sensor protein ArcB [Calycomorphotria hydatis]
MFFKAILHNPPNVEKQLETALLSQQQPLKELTLRSILQILVERPTKVRESCFLAQSFVAIFLSIPDAQWLCRLLDYGMEHDHPQEKIPGSDEALLIEREQHRADSDCDFYAVGIGASAGGLEALERLFRNMPVDTGMAFIIVQHLSPDFESHMDQLLSRVTDIPIHLVSDGIVVEPNQIYLIPPKKEMIISGGKLLLADKDVSSGFTHPIDHFFRSLAQELRRFAISIILSGTGSDGSRGIVEVHESGGLVISQSEETAQFDGMPLNAQETGAVDLILPPESMAGALVKYVNDNLAREKLTDQEIPQLEQDGLHEVFRLLQNDYGIDFSHYKPSTVSRRVARRLEATDSSALSDYIEYLHSHPNELNSLYRDLLIGVTRFFRDTDAYQALAENAISELVEREQTDELRIWVTGCASGEEAYTLAIMFYEAFELKGLVPRFKIFATDVHQSSLDFASAGIYDDESLEHVSPEHRDKYFSQERNGYRIRADIRRQIVFARHNVLTDAPFTRMDLISCRNLLIYFQPIAQQKVLTLFHFGLKLGSFLFLGPSESVDRLSNEFVTLDSKWKLFRKKRDVRLSAGDSRLITSGGRNSTTPISLRPSTHSELPSEIRVTESHTVRLSTYDRLLDRFMPPSILVDEDLNLMHAFNGGERFLTIGPGRPTINLFRLIPEAIRTVVMGAIQRARKEGSAVSYNAVVANNWAEGKPVNIIVEPIQDNTIPQTPLLITFELQSENDLRDSAPVKLDDVSKLTHERISSLETDLESARENLQATIEELETSNEELQATNEELVASNEELQSTNEELHSVNEELYTVNAEHQMRIQQLSELTDDMENLLTSSNVGVAFLDRNLEIRKFTPKVGEMFDILPSDIGRRITSFSHSFRYDGLIDDTQQVLEKGSGVEREVADVAGNPYLLRILPYKVDIGIDGVVITLIDISNLKAAESSLVRMRALIDSSDDAIISMDTDGVIRTWNNGAEKLYLYTEDEAIGQHISFLVPEDRVVELNRLLDRTRAGEHINHIQTDRIRKDGTKLRVSLGDSPIVDEHGQLIGISAIHRDFTEQLETAQKLDDALKLADQASNAKSTFLAHMSHEIRTPVASIMGLVDVLQSKGEFGEEGTQLFEMIRRSGEYLLSLINDILDLSKVESGKIEVERERVQLPELLTDIHGLFRFRMEQKELDFNVSSNGPIPNFIYSDSKRIRQILMNLLGNAVKFTNAGYVKLEVNFEPEQQALMFAVIDSGKGIDQDKKRQLFEPFTQFEDKNSASGGSGLGLSITKRLIELLGGTIEVDSEVDRGSTFLVTLPISHDEESGLETFESSLSAPFSQNREKQNLSLVGQRLLVVEDTPAMQLIVRKYLEDTGAEVDVAQTGSEAIERFRSNTEMYDLILLDMMLPDITGHEVAQNIRSTHSNLPVIALTASAMVHDREKCIEAGCDEYLSKPVDRYELISLVHQLVNRVAQPNG